MLANRRKGQPEAVGILAMSLKYVSDDQRNIPASLSEDHEAISAGPV
jgi:hypothetical protein